MTPDGSRDERVALIAGRVGQYATRNSAPGTGVEEGGPRQRRGGTYVWGPLAVLAIVLGAFIGALAGRLPRPLGAIAGFIVGLGALFPIECATSFDAVEGTVCRTAYGLALPNATAGVTGGVFLAVLLFVVVACLPVDARGG
jgi:hypothetical protein